MSEFEQDSARSVEYSELMTSMGVMSLRPFITACLRFSTEDRRAAVLP